MLALFTETLETLLKNKNYGEESEDSSLTEVLELLRQFPDFDFQSDSVHIEFTMETLFMQAYDIREIGAETEELFIHNWREKTNDLLMKWVPRIKMWIDNFNDLFKFTVKLQLSENRNSSDSGSDSNTNKYFLNPASASTENLKVQDVDTSNSSNSRSGSMSRGMSRDVLQTVWGKTRAMILDQIFNLQQVYLECLYEFEPIFMGLY